MCSQIKQDKQGTLIQVTAERFSLTLQHTLNIKDPSVSQSYPRSSNYSAQLLPGIHYLGPNWEQLNQCFHFMISSCWLLKSQDCHRWYQTHLWFYQSYSDKLSCQDNHSLHLKCNKEALRSISSHNFNCRQPCLSCIGQKDVNSMAIWENGVLTWREIALSHCSVIVFYHFCLSPPVMWPIFVVLKALYD